jgi:S1-C subfamily serine protease
LAGLKSATLFVLQSIVVGLAVAFLIVLIRPDLLPTITGGRGSAPASYADAVEISAPAVANIYIKRLVEYTPAADERTRFRVETAFGSAVVIDPEGYLITNFHVVAEAAEIRVQLSDGSMPKPIWRCSKSTSAHCRLSNWGIRGSCASAMWCLQ